MSDTNRPGGSESGTDRLRQTAEEAREAAGEKWSEATEQARSTAEATAEEARRRAEHEAERGKRMGAGQVHQWASALDRAADELGPDSAQGRFLHEAAEGLDDVARSIETRSVGDMVGAVADFGRRNPLAFVGGAMLTGFALSRFATASRPDPEWDDGSDYARRTPTPPRGPVPGAPTGPGASPSAGGRPGAAATPGAGRPPGAQAGEEERRPSQSARPEATGGPTPPYRPATGTPGEEDKS